jgi:hypothetical protein
MSIEAVEAVVDSKRAGGSRAGKGKAGKVCPFRDGSCYAILWGILFDNPTGITREALIREGVQRTGKDSKLVGFSVGVVLSPRIEGNAHPSVNRAADYYYVERIGDVYRLHLRQTAATLAGRA